MVNEKDVKKAKEMLDKHYKIEGVNPEYHTHIARLIVESLRDEPEELVEDGFGTAAPAICSECGCRAVYVCRPGDIRCGVCYDGNPKEWYVGKRCDECGFDAIHDGVCFYCVTDGPQVKLPTPGSKEYQKLLLTDKKVKKHGYGWMQNYDYEINELLKAQVDRVLALLEGGE